MATIDLSGTPVGDAVPADASQKVLRSDGLQFEMRPNPNG